MNRNITAIIKSQAMKLGFSACGVSRVVPLTDEAWHLTDWLSKGMHSGMHYMENHTAMRLNPALIVDDAKSVISVLFNYYPSYKQNDTDTYKLAKYAYGKDYHFVVRNRLKELIGCIRREAVKVNARAFADSAPVLEKYWAQCAGLGWIGKNSCLINRHLGSFFFIGEIILDLELDYDEPGKDHCGTCTRCINSCPTGAIVRPHVVDAGKCIAYLTIENREALPSSMKDRFRGWIFGCDICQDVCPWNRFAKAHHEPDLVPADTLLNMKKEAWESLTEKSFRSLFGQSAVSRTGYEGLKRNIAFLNDQPSP
jgi:epoxyqueuosine reductase